MKSRKLQLVGKRSYSITLPKTWINENKLTSGDAVFIEQNANNELTVKTSKTNTQTDNNLSVELDKVKGVQGFLRFCYMKNIDTIIIHSKRFQVHTVRQIQQVVKYIEGYDVTSESATSIEISFLYHEIDVRIERLMRRMLYLLNVMVESLEVKDYETLEEIEDAVDRLYLLAKRVLLRCQADSKVRQDNEITGRENVLFLWIVFKKMENIADSFRKMQAIDLSKTDIESIKEMLELVEKGFYHKSSSQEYVEEAFVQKRKRIKMIANPKDIVLETIYREVIDILQNIDYIYMNQFFFTDN